MTCKPRIIQRYLGGTDEMKPSGKRIAKLILFIFSVFKHVQNKMNLHIIYF